MRTLTVRSALMLPAFAFACSKPPEEESLSQPAVPAFSVVDTLLGATFSLADPGLVIRPPLGWLPLDSTRSATLLEHFKTGDGPLRLLPTAIFLDSLSGCVLVVSGWESDSSRWESVAALQQARLEERYAGKEPRFNHILLNGQRCMHSIVQDSLLTNYKLLLDFGAQLDYLVPRSTQQDPVKRIESSIGSLKAVPSQ